VLSSQVEQPWEPISYARGWDACTVPGMNEPIELAHNKHWRAAVWALRVGYVALFVGLIGLVVLELGHTPWVLASGVIVWAGVAIVTSTNFFWAWAEMSKPRPGYWALRLMLIRDSVRIR
jgi:hypothetical protein